MGFIWSPQPAEMVFDCVTGGSYAMSDRSRHWWRTTASAHLSASPSPRHPGLYVAEISGSCWPSPGIARRQCSATRASHRTRSPHHLFTPEIGHRTWRMNDARVGGAHTGGHRSQISHKAYAVCRVPAKRRCGGAFGIGKTLSLHNGLTRLGVNHPNFAERLRLCRCARGGRSR